MKKIISILLFACAGALAACDFLDVVPEGQATQEDIFKTSKEARKYLNTLYTYAPNIAAYRYMPDFCAGDDIITATNGQTRYFPYKSMLYNEENASQTYYGLWDATTSSPSGRTNYDMYKGIRYCYIMIDNIDAVPGISPSVADEFKGEAYFLIAYYHWVLLTHYGPVILVRGQLDMGLPEEQVYVARSPFDECVTFIAETYDRAADLLHGYPTRPDADLGRATSVAAKAMKARLLLYAASPLCNGNTEFYARFRNNDGTPLMSQTYNPEKWKWALDASKEYQSCTGYILKKWIHRQSAFNYDTKSWTYRKYAYPYIRLAELYLSYAEADFEYNGSLSDASLNYLNLVRRRSGLPDFKDSWALAGGIPTGDELRKVLHRERSIELLMEGMRYHDLRRWKEAGEAMSRRPKAWNLDGRTAADFYRVSTMKESGVRTFESPKTYWMAIPLSEININYNLVQNPGY